MAHLPVTRTELAAFGWDTLDFLFISGDAYVDHPAFGCALLARLLVANGYRVGLVPQPDVNDPKCLMRLGRPRLGVLATSGVVDSMVNHYTAARRKRSTDAYSPGGQSGWRPDRALIRYGQLVREQWGDMPLIIGGVEAGLRRFAHYDVWSDQVRNSILTDSTADLCVTGEGEKTLLEIARLLARGVPVKRLTSLPGTSVRVRLEQLPKAVATFIRETDDLADLDGACPQDAACIRLPSVEAVRASKRAYALAFQARQAATKTVIQPDGAHYIVQNPPRPFLTEGELDQVYGLPFERTAHPYAQALGGVPALAEVQFSITAHRGCYGGCHFCAIGQHMGRAVRARSDASVLEEARRLTRHPDFKGIISDVGGPTANFHLAGCRLQERGLVCPDRACLTPALCPELKIDHGPYFALLDQVRRLPGVKKAFVRSGIRYDLLLADPQADRYLEQLSRHHISGQLRVAPEHSSPAVLAAMGKPSFASYLAFIKRFAALTQGTGRQQFVVPYLMSGHPGSKLDDAIDLALTLKTLDIRPQQVQAFIPTPGTWSTVASYTGLNPDTLAPIHVPDPQEQRLQRALLQASLPRNHQAVRQALEAAGRQDLIGPGPACLLAPSAASASSKHRRHRPSHPPLTKKGKKP